MKLLFILLLALGFSQTKLETRVYELTISDNDILNIFDITGYEFDYYILKLVDVSYPSDEQGNLTFNSTENGAYQLHYQMGWGRLTYSDDESWEQRFIHSDLWIDTTFNPFNIKIAVTAEFPEEDTGYIEDGFQFCLHEGANLVSYPCDNSVPVEESLPNGIENFVNSIIGEGVATSYTASGWVGSLSSFGAGDGYWFISNSDVCFEYECVAN